MHLFCALFDERVRLFFPWSLAVGEYALQYELLFRLQI